MKKSILTGIILAFSTAMVIIISAAALLAQPQRPDPEEMAKMQTDRMQKELELTEDQVVSVSEINLRYAKQMDEMFSESGGDREAMRGKMQESQAKKDEELKLVLTDEQFTKWKKMQGSMRGGPGGRGRGPERN